MKKIYVDDIAKKKDTHNPGPGKYDLGKSFGAKGSHYTMAERLPHGEQALGRSKKLPGPGSYASTDLTGKDLKTSVMKNASTFP